ncbi:hypothetical protein Tco_1229505 [Tanacetum coccineum]
MQCVTMPAIKPKVLALGVNSSTEANGSKPRSNTKNNRILPAKNDNKNKVEAHPRNNNSKLKQENRVDSSISSKCTKPTGRKFTLGEQCLLTRFTKSKVVPLQQHDHVSSSEIVITERFSNNSQKPLTRYKRKNKQEKAISNGIPITAETQSIGDSVQYTTVSARQQDPTEISCSKHMMRNRSRLKNFMKKFIGTVRFENDYFGAIIGYGNYMIDDSVISSVYYVEGDASIPVVSAGIPSSTTIDQDAPSTSHLPLSSKVQPPISHQGVAVGPTIEDNPFAQAEDNPFVNVFAPEPSSEESSSGDVSSAESNQVIQPHNHLGKWSKDHPMDNIIGNPSRLVSTRKQLATDALWCFYNSVLSKVEPNNFKLAILSLLI